VIYAFGNPVGSITRWCQRIWPNKGSKPLGDKIPSQSLPVFLDHQKEIPDFGAQTLRRLFGCSRHYNYANSL